MRVQFPLKRPCRYTTKSPCPCEMFFRNLVNVRKISIQKYHFSSLKQNQQVIDFLTTVQRLGINRLAGEFSIVSKIITSSLQHKIHYNILEEYFILTFPSITYYF